MGRQIGKVPLPVVRYPALCINEVPQREEKMAAYKSNPPG